MRQVFAAILTLSLATWGQPAFADPQDEADVRRVLRAIAGMDLKDATTKRRIETVLAEEALANWQGGRFVQFREEPETVRVFDNGWAVARYQRRGNITYDAYVYLHHDPVWRVAAIRAMARTGTMIELKQRLESIWFRTPEQNAQLETLRLTLATDRELRQWFERHHKDLDVIANAYRQAVTQAPVTAGAADPFALVADLDTPIAKPLTAEQAAAASDIAARCSALRLSGVTALTDEQAPGTNEQAPVQVIVGGILDDTVGFVHAPAGAPEVSPGRFIWVESLGGDWYLIRTT
jgi:hypothetical protein